MEKERKEQLDAARREFRKARGYVRAVLFSENDEYIAMTEAERKSAEGRHKADIIDMLDDAVDEISCLIDTLEECKKEAVVQ